MELVIGAEVGSADLHHDVEDKKEAEEDVPCAQDGEDGENNYDVGSDVVDASEGIDESALENVHVLIEDLEHLSDGGDVEEQVDRGEENLVESGSVDVDSHGAVASLVVVVLGAVEENTGDGDQVDPPHVFRVALGLGNGVSGSELVLCSLPVPAEVLVEQGDECDDGDGSSSSNTLEDLPYSLPVRSDDLVSLIDEKSSELLLKLIAEASLDTSEAGELLIDLGVRALGSLVA